MNLTLFCIIKKGQIFSPVYLPWTIMMLSLQMSHADISLYFLTLLPYLMDEYLCFAECCQAEWLSWPSAASPELCAVALGEVIPRNLPLAVFVPCPLVVAADGSVPALWLGSGLALPGWCSAAALGPGKVPNISPNALVLARTKVAHNSIFTWVAGLGRGPARAGGGEGLCHGRGGIGRTGKYRFCLVFCCCGLQCTAGETLQC